MFALAAKAGTQCHETYFEHEQQTANTDSCHAPFFSPKKLNAFYGVKDKKVYFLNERTEHYSGRNGCAFGGCTTVVEKKYHLLEPQPNIQTFKPLFADQPFAIGGDRLYYEAKQVVGVTLSAGMQASDLKPLVANDFSYRGYQSLQQYILYEGAVVEDADAASFKTLPYFATNGVLTESSLALDRRHVYWEGKVVPLADPASLQRIDQYFMRDNAHAWKMDIGEWVLQEEVHPVVKKISASHVSIGQAVYFRSQPIVDADAASFKALALSCTKASPTCSGTAGALCSSESFPSIMCEPVLRPDQQIVGQDGSLVHPFGRDARHVFLGTTSLTNADPDSFEILLHRADGSVYAADKNAIYVLDEKDNRLINRIGTEGSVYGPMFFENGGLHSDRPIFADRRGFFEAGYDGRRLTSLCAEPVGTLRPVDQLNDRSRWVFEDENFYYYLLKPDQPYQIYDDADKNYVFNERQNHYLINKKTKERTPVFYVPLTCKPQ